MTVPPKMSRRTFLIAAAGFGVSLAWRSVGSWPFFPVSSSPSERLAGLLTHAESARVVGREYLRGVPAEGSSAVLTARIAARLPGGLETVDSASDRRLRELLLGATLTDFEHERTVVLDGWVLSQTEARLCALAVMAGRPTPA
jgi:hypothetical protein